MTIKKKRTFIWKQHKKTGDAENHQTYENGFIKENSGNDYSSQNYIKTEDSEDDID